MRENKKRHIAWEWMDHTYGQLKLDGTGELLAVLSSNYTGYLLTVYNSRSSCVTEQINIRVQ